MGHAVYRMSQKRWNTGLFRKDDVLYKSCRISSYPSWNDIGLILRDFITRSSWIF